MDEPVMESRRTPISYSLMASFHDKSISRDRDSASGFLRAYHVEAPGRVLTGSSYRRRMRGVALTTASILALTLLSPGVLYLYLIEIKIQDHSYF